MRSKQISAIGAVGMLSIASAAAAIVAKRQYETATTSTTDKPQKFEGESRQVRRAKERAAIKAQRQRFKPRGYR